MKRKILIIMAFVMVVGSFVCPDDADAISIPKISVDPSSLKMTDRSRTFVSGTVYPAAGQIIVLYSPNRKKVIGAVRVSKGGGNTGFKIKVDEAVLEGKTSITLYLRSCAEGDVAASKYIPVEIKDGAAKATKAESRTTKATKTKVKTTKATKAKVKTKKTKKKIRKKAKKTVKKKTKKATKKTRKARKKRSRPTTAAEGRAAAVAWARKIAADNRFTYGTVPYSRHNGCYFCGTNGGKKKRARGTRWAKGYNGKKWDKTYCCNPFVHACYAHGAMHPRMLRYCKSKSAIDMSRSSYRRMGCFRCLGKPGLSKLIPGDILVSSNHVMLYCGNGEIAEATSLGGRKRSWSASSIRVVKNAKKKYRSCRFVMRFTGY